MPEIREFVVRRVAQLEIQDAANWYDDRVPELGVRFIEEVDACFESVRVTPERYPVVHREIRRALLKQFPYAVYFVRRNDAVVVLACMHTRRHPKLWQGRR